MTNRWRVRVWDLLLTAVLLAAALLVHATGYDAVPANRHPDALSFLFTVVAILPLVLRRSRPLGVLVACFPGLLALMALHFPVGTSVIGVEVAFYTVAAWDTRRNARWGVLVLLAGVCATVLLDPLDLSAEGIAVNGAVLLGGWVLGTGTRDRRERHAVEMLRAEAQAQAERDRAARATAEERLRITRELHDVLGHALSVMVVQAGVAEHLLDTQPATARRAIAAITATGRTSLTEMRRMLAVLREGDGDRTGDGSAGHGSGGPTSKTDGNPAGSGLGGGHGGGDGKHAGMGDRDGGTGQPYDPAPRLAQLPGLIQRVQAAGLDVTLTMTGTSADPPPDVPEGVELAAYRIVQEALTNCLKHARAHRAEVRLTCTPEGVEVEVVDDGVGKAGGPAGAGHGLTGMRERVSVYRGELATGPVDGGGFRVWARFPLRAGVQAR